jgi:hypothetical protein
MKNKIEPVMSEKNHIFLKIQMEHYVLELNCPFNKENAEMILKLFNGAR